MAIKPLNDRVVVQFVEEEEKTKSGIVLPDTAKGEKPQQGEVIAVGKGCEDCDIKTGDQVVFDKYAGTKVNIDDVEYIIIKVDDVLAVIE